MSAIKFRGQVAVVTGAGNGLGRAYALELAKRGASVVVNDTGGNMRGSQNSRNAMAADAVVEQIRSRGGKAVANYDSVENGQAVIKTAIDNYGKVDVLINNAGILRDISFKKMSEIDWDKVIKVHLYGAFSCTKAAWPYMIEQKYGRLLFTSSNSAIHGNFSQANYAAAKAGVIGFSHTLAIEGKRHNILSNVLVPSALTRMSELLFKSSEERDILKPEYIEPIVSYLVSSECNETGKIFEAGGNHFNQIKPFSTHGLNIKHATAESVRDEWQTITDDTNVNAFTSIFDATSAAIKSGLSSLGVGGGAVDSKAEKTKI